MLPSFSLPSSSSLLSSSLSPLLSSSSSVLSPAASVLAPTIDVAIAGERIISTINGLRRKTLIRVPRGSRPLAAQALQKALNKVVINPADLASWRHLLCLTYLCLHVLTHSNAQSSKEKSLTSKVNTGVRRFVDALDGDSLPIVIEDDHSPPKRKNWKPKDAKKALAVRVSQKISEGDVKGAVRVASSDDTLIPPNTDMLEVLRQKHPPKASGCTPAAPPVPAPPQYQADEAQVLKAVRSFPNGSGGGLDGLKPQHLKDLIGDTSREHEKSLLRSLTLFINLVLEGGVPGEIRPIFLGASLCALRKKDDGVRPIAIGNTLRRLVSKVAVSACRDRCSNLLQPNQLGFGVKRGAEAAIHAARSFINGHDDMVLLKIDFANAFNSIRRDKALEAVREHLPNLFNYSCSSYGATSFLAYGNHLVPSEEGVQQGDPLGPLLFCLTILPIIKCLSSPLNMWYLDDGNLAGTPAQVLTDFQIIQSEGIQRGLQVNLEKCEVVGLSDTCDITLFQHVHHVRVTDLTLLGAPLGEQAMSTILEKKISELTTMGSRLEWISAHHALYLLRNCFSLPKLLYILRTSPCFDHPLVQSFDDLQIQLLQKLLNINLDDRAGSQASLPVRFGGLGVISAVKVAPSAYISSKLSCDCLEASLVLHSTVLAPVSTPPSTIVSDLDRAITFWKASCDSEDQPTSTHQRDWTSPVFQKAQKLLLNSAVDAQDKARLLAVAQKEAGSWLEALPVPSLGLHLSDDELRVIASLHLGIPTCIEHTCICNEKVGILGTHGLKCKKSKGRWSHHHSVNDIIARALTLANVPAILEPPGIVREDGKRPDGMTNIPWSHGRHLVWDYTCPDTLAPSHLQATSNEAGSAAKTAEVRKVAKYQSLAVYYTFVPIAIETLGSMGPEAKTFLLELGQRLRQQTGEPRSTSFLLQRISMAIQKGNAIAIMGSIPRGKVLGELLEL